MTKKEKLLTKMKEAINGKAQFFGVIKSYQHHDDTIIETVITPKESMKFKIAFYDEYYNDDMVHKIFPNQIILDYKLGNAIEDFNDLEHKDNSFQFSSKDKLQTQKITVPFEFESEMQIQEFLEWLSNSGEQDYWKAVETMGDKAMIQRIDYPFEYGTGKVLRDKSVICKS